LVNIAKRMERYNPDKIGHQRGINAVKLTPASRLTRRRLYEVRSA
jgi:hypothetical protein